MFSTAKAELRELVDLTERIATYDATLAAKRDIEVEEPAAQRRRTWEMRKIDLMRKYELL